ncbi:hypothetical protein BDY19DRAFT_993903 [Irpex rosettiformis]|uniref:Uncharacterized protein n=1 Tax=Irpex rosettiformis TaxID=378272 RepID=A0ACB8U2C4_9APHY|nr:hypothetical protein BDY19DRAFT_993903 [Irpex rosettiformis]
MSVVHYYPSQNEHEEGYSAPFFPPSSYGQPSNVSGTGAAAPNGDVFAMTVTMPSMPNPDTVGASPTFGETFPPFPPLPFEIVCPASANNNNISFLMPSSAPSYASSSSSTLTAASGCGYAPSSASSAPGPSPFWPASPGSPPSESSHSYHPSTPPSESAHSHSCHSHCSSAPQSYPHYLSSPVLASQSACSGAGSPYGDGSQFQQRPQPGTEPLIVSGCTTAYHPAENNAQQRNSKRGFNNTRVSTTKHQHGYGHGNGHGGRRRGPPPNNFNPPSDTNNIFQISLGNTSVSVRESGHVSGTKIGNEKGQSWNKSRSRSAWAMAMRRHLAGTRVASGDVLIEGFPNSARDLITLGGADIPDSHTHEGLYRFPGGFFATRTDPVAAEDLQTSQTMSSSDRLRKEMYPTLERDIALQRILCLANVTSGLLHFSGWAHRDISTGNILYNEKIKRWMLSDVRLETRDIDVAPIPLDPDENVGPCFARLAGYVSYPAVTVINYVRHEMQDFQDVLRTDEQSLGGACGDVDCRWGDLRHDRDDEEIMG